MHALMQRAPDPYPANAGWTVLNQQQIHNTQTPCVLSHSNRHTNSSAFYAHRRHWYLEVREHLPCEARRDETKPPILYITFDMPRAAAPVTDRLCLRMG